MNSMLPLLLLLRDDEPSAPKLEPRIQTVVDELNQVNDLIDLINKMGLEDLAVIPPEWIGQPGIEFIHVGGANEKIMDLIIETMNANPS